MFEEDLSREAHARVGSTVGKYRLESVLGVGGTASVYAGVHRNGNRVAIKVLHMQFAANDSMRARFLREGYVANKVDHPGTVRVLDDESTDDATYLVMDLLEGETLDERSQRTGGALPASDVVHHAIALLDVLERAHAHGIIHRDLKPENVFLTLRQELKILDFGIARLRDSNLAVTATQTGTMLGTPAYLAPEQALGHVDQIDVRTDVWATGATLFTLLTGRHVHKGRSAQEALVFAATQPAPPVKSIAPQVPDAVASVVDRALRFRREERWQSASEMRAALIGTGVAGLTVPLGRAAPLHQSAPTDPRQAATMMTASTGSRTSSSTSQMALAGALFGLVALGGIIAGLVVLKRRNEPPPEPEPAVALVASSAMPADEPEVEQLPLPTALPVAETASAPAIDAGAAIETKPAPTGPATASPVRTAKLPPPKPSAAPKDLWDPR